MKILFVQLPLVDHGLNYILGNVPSAPATLAAYIKNTFPGSVNIDFLPSLIANLGSNTMILRYISATMPDTLCFTSYLWNSERNLSIAREVKKRYPGMRVIMGGTEIARGSWVLSEFREEVDLFVKGEGEWFFDRYLGGIDEPTAHDEINGNRVWVQPEKELLKARRIVEPLNAGYLHPMMDGSVFFELTRGCPYRCSYCYYSKNCRTVRELPFELLLRALTMKTHFSLRELYLLSPTFNKTRDFKGRLRQMAELNPGVSLHTEMRTDHIDKQTASMIKKAGFRSLEVGLQTMTAEARRMAGRNCAVEDELRGMDFLKDQGLDLKIGIIPGLPGDTVEGFNATMAELSDRGLGDSIELYPLMVLPGTAIREQGEKDHVLFQKKPPYLFLEGWNFSHDDMRDIVEEAEELTGLTHTVKRLPDFCRGDGNGLVQGVRFRVDETGMWEGGRLSPLIETSVFSFHMEMGVTLTPGEALGRLLSGIPMEHQLYNVILYTDRVLEEEPLAEQLARFDRDSFYRRLWVYSPWRDGHVISLYQVFRKYKPFFKARESYGLVSPVLMINAETAHHLESFPEDDPPDIVVAGGAFGRVGDALPGRYRDFHERISFEDEREQRLFYSRAGLEWSEWPSLRIVSIY